MTSWRHQLLPGDLREDAGRSGRDWAVDAMMALIALALSALVLWQVWTSRPSWLNWLDVGAGCVAFASLWWRRAHPDRVGILTAALSIFSGVAGGPAVVALFNTALRGSRRGIAAVVALSVVASVAFPLLWPGRDDSDVALSMVIGALFLGVSLGWGFLVRVRREQIRKVRRDAVAFARDAERRRIAREMHDVLAHRVSLLSLQAGALEFNPDAPPEAVAKAAGVIRETARTALEELRDVIGILRDGEVADGPTPPQPTLIDLPALIDESRAAGMDITADLEAPDVPASLGRTAYRIVQEGLTNARKHAPGAAVRLAIGATDAGLTVDVISRRRVGVAVAAPLPGAGAGLIGLTERVALAGGELDHGADASGDFHLSARLPWSAS